MKTYLFKAKYNNSYVTIRIIIVNKKYYYGYEYNKGLRLIDSCNNFEEACGYICGIWGFELIGEIQI